MRRPTRYFAPVLALFAGAVAHAQGPVLHEVVHDVREDEALVLTVRGEAEPAGIVYDGEVIAAPNDGALQPDERAMTAFAGDGEGQEQAGQRSPTFRPDRVTALEGTLGYYSVFSPTIAPFKRVTALDGVSLDGETPVLGVFDPADTQAVPVVGVGATPPDDRPRDRFWGSVVLDFTDGRRVPMPSVSPESRILTLRTEPRIELRIEKDAADNFFAVAPGSLASSQVRVTFLTDAPRDYFNAQELPVVRADSLAAEARPLPEDLLPRALDFAGELGLSRGMSVAEVVRELTRHYRSFEESDSPPENTGDIYLDLSRGMKGICRHRAYGFVITALALGIPSRFVMNEAHAWAEVKMMTIGWMRIDLGGAAQGLDAHNAEDRPVYRAAHADPLPRPDVYEASYSQLGGDVSGIRRDPPPSQGTQSSAESGPSETAGDGSAGSSATGSASGGGRGRLVLAVDRNHYEVFRGRDVRVSGRATGGSGEAAGGLRIEVHLEGDGLQELLGVTVTRSDGYYNGTFGIPPDIDVGDYRLLVRSPGDAQYLAATAR